MLTCESSGKKRLPSARLILSLMILSLGVIKAEVSTLGVLYTGNVSQFRRHTVEHVVNEMLQSDTNQVDVQIRIVWDQKDTDDLGSLHIQVCEMLEDGALGVVSIIPKKTKDFPLYTADDLCLPHMSIAAQSAIPVYRKGFNKISSTQNQLVQDLLHYFHWKAVGIFHHTHIDKYQFTDLIFSLSERLVQVTLIDPKVFSGPRKHWSAVPNRVLFIGTPDQFYRLYEQLEGTSLTSDTLWLVVSEEMTAAEITHFFAQKVKGGIVFVKRTWKDTYICDGSSMYKGEDTYLSVTEDLLARSLLVLHEAVYKTNTTDNRTGADNCSGCAEKWKATCADFWRDMAVNDRVLPFPFSPMYEIHSFENVWRRRGGSFRRKTGTKIGEWNKDSGLDIQQDFLFQNVWHDFGNETVYVAAIESPPFIIKTQIGGATRFTGFCVDVMNELASKMGFSYTIVEPPDGYFGALNMDGTWNGMVGMVYRGEVEMATGPVTITSLREQVIDFTTPITEGSTGIIMRSPGYAAGKSLLQTLKPFSTAVWLSICAAIVVVSIVSYFVNNYTPYKTRYCQFPEEEEMTSFKGNFWIIYASITEQGIDAHPSSTSGRCILGFWWVFTIVLVAAYTANLTAVLTVVIPPSPISSLRQLLAQDDIQPIVLAGSSFETLFQNSESELYKETWERLKKAPKVAQEPAILEMVKHGGYGYIADKPILDYRASRECQAFSVAEESFDVVGYGIVIPEGVPYANSMNRLIVKMQEAGLMEKWRRRWWSTDTSCKDSFQTVQSRLGLGSLGGLFLLYIGTVVLACFFCLSEMLCKRHCKTEAS